MLALDSDPFPRWSTASAVSRFVAVTAMLAIFGAACGGSSATDRQPAAGVSPKRSYTRRHRASGRCLQSLLPPPLLRNRRLQSRRSQRSSTWASVMNAGQKLGKDGSAQTGLEQSSAAMVSEFSSRPGTARQIGIPAFSSTTTWFMWPGRSTSARTRGKHRGDVLSTQVENRLAASAIPMCGA